MGTSNFAYRVEQMGKIAKTTWQHYSKPWLRPNYGLLLIYMHQDFYYGQFRNNLNHLQWRTKKGILY
jgi:hypothetical protein